MSDVLSHDDIGSAVASLFQQNAESIAIAQADEEHAANKDEEPILNALDGIHGVVVTETPEVMDTVTVATEAVTSFDYNDVVVMLAALQSKSKTSQTWNKRDTNDLHDIIMRKEVCGKMTTNDILICLESSRTQDDNPKVHFCKSWKKARLASTLQEVFFYQMRD